MNKYLKYYYVDSFLVLLFIILNYCFDLDQMTFYDMYGSGTFFLVPALFILISIISFIYNIACHISKHHEFNEKNLLFPKYYLIFYILLVILGLIYNELAFIPGLHVMYYFTFGIIGNAMLSIYTSLSYNRIKITKKARKKNK